MASSLKTLLSPAKIVIGILGLLTLLLASLTIYQSFNIQAQGYNPTTDPEANNSDYNIDLLEIIADNNPVQIAPFTRHNNHWVDPGAPKFSTLVQGRVVPIVGSVSLYRPDGTYIDTRANESTYSDRGGVILGTQSGDVIQVPWAGYEVSPGRHAVISYADENTISITYNAEANIASGYTVQLQGLRVNSDILKLYQNAKAAGQIAALSAGTAIGVATTEQLIALMRDTGAFLDPSWEEWWNLPNNPLTPLSPELLALIRQQFPNPLLAEAQRFSCSVNGTIPDDGEFRPAPCENCSLQVPEPVLSCSEKTTITKMTEEISCEDISECNDQYVYYETWKVNFLLDTRESKVPFAGFHETKKIGGRSENLNQYINDYFDGTSLYDGDPYLAGDPVAQRNLIWEAGVARKLLPQQIQDEKRIELIKEGLDYEITQIGMTMQQWNGHFPPKPNEYPNSQAYTAAYTAWQQSDPWGKYWHYIPIFSREDAPGKATLQIQANPGELTPLAAGNQVSTNKVEIPLSIPHLTRMYQVTQTLNELLLPEIQAAEAGLPITPRSVVPAADNTCVSAFGVGYATALGCIPTGVAGFVAWVLQWGSMAGGGIAFLIIAWGALSMITAAGQPEPIQFGRTLIIAGLVGLLTIIFGVMILRWVMRDILEIPGVSSEPSRMYQIAGETTRAQESLAERDLTPPDYTVIQQSNNYRTTHYPLPTNSRTLFASAQTQADTLALGDLLAQADAASGNAANGGIAEGDNCTGMRLIVENKSDHYAVKGFNTMPQACGDPSDYSFEVKYFIGNQQVGGCNEYVGGGNYLPHYNPTSEQPTERYGLSITDMASGRCRVTTTPQQSGNAPLRVEYKVFNSHASDAGGGCTKAPSCNCPPGDTSCEAPPQLPPPPVIPQCGNGTQGLDECSANGIIDPNPDKDPLCCSGGVEATMTNYVSAISEQEYKNVCECEDEDDDGKCDGPPKSSIADKPQQREIEDKLELPYLQKSWDYSAGEMGFFQIFNPGHMLTFPDTDAISDIAYEATTMQAIQTKNNDVFTPGKASTLSTSEGEFDFPFLGGLHKTKKCISEVLLTPLALQNGETWCEFEATPLESRESPDSSSGDEEENEDEDASSGNNKQTEEDRQGNDAQAADEQAPITSLGVDATLDDSCKPSASNPNLCTGFIDDGTMQIITYNMGALSGDTVDLEAVANELLQQMQQNPNALFVLQELSDGFDNDATQYLNDFFASNNVSYALTGRDGQNGNATGGGGFVSLKYAFDKSDLTNLNDAVQAAGGEASAYALHVNGVNVYNVHNSSNVANNPSSVSAIMQVIGNPSGFGSLTQGPVVIAGDFNREGIGNLSSIQGYTNACSGCGITSKEKDQAIDYTLISNGTSIVPNQSKVLTNFTKSDHYAVQTIIRTR